ncbi:hypothetical protein ACE6JH_15075 [Streptomyces nigra]
MPPTEEPPHEQATWGVYRGTGHPGPGGGPWPDPPGRRSFGGGPLLPAPADDPYAALLLGEGTSPLPFAPDEVDRVNAALCLRRPLLVSGEPGTGKASLAHRIGRELALGRVLHWRITSLSTLREGLFAGEGGSVRWAPRFCRTAGPGSC